MECPKQAQLFIQNPMLLSACRDAENINAETIHIFLRKQN